MWSCNTGRESELFGLHPQSCFFIVLPVRQLLKFCLLFWFFVGKVHKLQKQHIKEEFHCKMRYPTFERCFYKVADDKTGISKFISWPKICADRILTIYNMKRFKTSEYIVFLASIDGIPLLQYLYISSNNGVKNLLKYMKMS